MRVQNVKSPLCFEEIWCTWKLCWQHLCLWLNLHGWRCTNKNWHGVSWFWKRSYCRSVRRLVLFTVNIYSWWHCWCTEHKLNIRQRWNPVWCILFTQKSMKAKVALHHHIATECIIIIQTSVWMKVDVKRKQMVCVEEACLLSPSPDSELGTVNWTESDYTKSMDGFFLNN